MTSNQLVQMALSAILRCKERVDLFELNDILCGKLTKAVKQDGYNSIKTFGAGKLYTKRQWHYWLIQMIQQEFFLIDYDDNDYLKVLEKGHQVLKGDINVTLKRLANDSMAISRNGVTYYIDVDIQDSINWRKYINDFNKLVYWNYKEEQRVDVNKIVPQDIKERERVKVKFIELLTQIYDLTCEDEIIIIPKKVDRDIYGNEVKPLSLPFDECLSRLEQFIITTGRYPQMKALADEAALRKWYREVGHGVIPTTLEQREKFKKFSSQYPNTKYNQKQE